jgi:hypothetical protein
MDQEVCADERKGALMRTWWAVLFAHSSDGVVPDKVELQSVLPFLRSSAGNKKSLQAQPASS